MILRQNWQGQKMCPIAEITFELLQVISPPVPVKSLPLLRELNGGSWLRGKRLKIAGGSSSSWSGGSLLSAAIVAEGGRICQTRTQFGLYFSRKAGALASRGRAFGIRSRRYWKKKKKSRSSNIFWYIRSDGIPFPMSKKSSSCHLTRFLVVNLHFVIGWFFLLHVLNLALLRIVSLINDFNSFQWFLRPLVRWFVNVQDLSRFECLSFGRVVFFSCLGLLFGLGKGSLRQKKKARSTFS